MSLKHCTTRTASAISFGVFLSITAWAQTPAAIPSSGSPASLFALEIKTGPNWNNAKQPHEQEFFREHSANLKGLRDQGILVLGARYSDKGLVVLQAASAEVAHTMMKQDPSIQAKVFAYELHEFSVFYGGSVQAKKRGQ